MFAERLKQERQLAKLSQDDIADVCLNRDGQPLSRAAVSLWEKPGGNKPTFENLVAIAKRLSASIDYLVGLSDKKEQGTKLAVIDEELLNRCFDVVERQLTRMQVPKNSSAWSPKNIRKLAVFEYNQAMERRGSTDGEEVKKQKGRVSRS